MLSLNKNRFEHRIKTTMGQLRMLLKLVDADPSGSYGQLYAIEKSIEQAKMFIIKDLLEQLNKADKKKADKVLHELYDCLGFHRDELPNKHNTR